MQFYGPSHKWTILVVGHPWSRFETLQTADEHKLFGRPKASIWNSWLPATKHPQPRRYDGVRRRLICRTSSLTPVTPLNKSGAESRENVEAVIRKHRNMFLRRSCHHFCSSPGRDIQGSLSWSTTSTASERMLEEFRPIVAKNPGGKTDVATRRQLWSSSLTANRV